MAKLERKALSHWLDSSWGGQTVAWYKLGVDLEELTIELNPDVETVKNILGETSVRDKGYEPSTTVDPYYANPSDAIYEDIREIAMDRKVGDACKTKMLEVIIEDTTDTAHLAYTEDVIVKPTSYGGGTDGVMIPFNLHPCGNRVKGTVAFANGVPTFTEAT